MYRYAQSDHTSSRATMISPGTDTNGLPAGTIIWVTITSFLFLTLAVIVAAMTIANFGGLDRPKARLRWEWGVWKFWVNARYEGWKEDRRSKRERCLNLRGVLAQGIELQDVQVPQTAHLV